MVPANFVCDRGTWYRVKEGIEAGLVTNKDGASIVYPLSEPSSHYFQVMTRQARMPVLHGERI